MVPHCSRVRSREIRIRNHSNQRHSNQSLAYHHDYGRYWKESMYVKYMNYNILITVIDNGMKWSVYYINLDYEI